jgi:cytoskeletal protein CcmA (bactofilin family)
MSDFENPISMSRCPMWKKEDARPEGVSGNIAAPATAAATPAAPVKTATPSGPAPAGPALLSGAPASSSRAAACISHGIRIKGEVTGSEDLFVDGLVDGKLNLANGSLTIGPNGHVMADVYAREVIVRGKIEGKVSGRDRVELWSTGEVTGEVQTERLSIEDGASLRGKVEAGRPTTKTAEIKAQAAAAGGKPMESKSMSSGTAAD